MTKSPWNTVLNSAELDAYYALTASLDPSYARAEREFYESRTADQLRELMAGAWNACIPDTYQLARSYLARMQPSPNFTDVSTVTEYGLTQKLSNSVRVF